MNMKSFNTSQRGLCIKKKQGRRRKLTITILSLSLLTVMAGAAVAPALDVIRSHFDGANQLFIQMIISIPSIFIVLTNLVFPRLCKVFRIKELTLAGLLLYVIGGCLAGVFDNIIVVLVFRALVGVGVGIIMPMSTGLISFYYTRDKQDKLMGYSSAMNQMGGVVATLISGLLASISWRASFLVYMMGLFSIILCFKHLPDEKFDGTSGRKKTAISNSKTNATESNNVKNVTSSDSENTAASLGGKKQLMNSNSKKEPSVFRQNYMFIVAIFLSMFIFFVYPSVFAIETAKDNIIPHTFVTVIMTGLDVIAIFGGLSFVHVKNKLGLRTKFVGPACFFVGYVALLMLNGWAGAIVGSVFIGFANGLEIPFIISTVSQRAGKTAATTVLPLISMSMYLAQFVTPMVLTFISELFTVSADFHLAYLVAAICSAVLIVWSVTIRDAKGKHVVVQESHA